MSLKTYQKNIDNPTEISKEEKEYILKEYSKLSAGDKIKFLEMQEKILFLDEIIESGKLYSTKEYKESCKVLEDCIRAGEILRIFYNF